MALIDDIAAFLEDNGIGTVGIDLFKAEMPDNDASIGIPHQAVGIIRTGGSSSSMAERTRNVTFQIVVRSGADSQSGATEANLTAAYDLAEDIRSLLHADDGSLSVDFTMDGNTRVLTTRAIQEPFNLGKDDKGRYRIVANYELLVVNS